MVNARDSLGNAYGVLISPESWRTLAGGNGPVMLRPGEALDSIAGCPIRPIRRIRPILPLYLPLLTPNQLLIKVDYSLRPPLSQASHKPIIRPENKGIRPKSNRHKPNYSNGWK